MSETDMQVSVADGKYTVVIHPDGTGTALRYGDLWLAANPISNMMLAFAHELAEVRAALAAHKEVAGDALPATVKPDLADGAAGQPERLWLSGMSADGERAVWFDPDEGGTEYIRADRAHALPKMLRASLAAAEESRDTAHAALVLIPVIADEIFERWDKDMRPGKILTALAGRLKDYRPDVTGIIATIMASPAAAKAKAVEAERDAAIARAKEAEAERDDALRTLIRVRGALQ